MGDCAHSWGYDGYRQQKWHRGEGTPYGPQTGVIWKAGDIVGCLLELRTEAAPVDAALATAVPPESATKGGKKRKSTATSASAAPAACANVVTATLSYTVNGVSHGAAFEFSLGSSELAEGLQFYPAVSLENEESVLLNVGNAPFKHGHSGATTVWEAITGVSPSESTSSPTVTDGVSAPAVVESVDDAAASSGSGASKDVGVTSVQASAAAVPTAVAPAEPVEYAAIALEDEQYSDAVSLEALGLVHLKQELERRGLKTGGTLQERAQRLFSVRGLTPAQYDPKLLAKKK